LNGKCSCCCRIAEQLDDVDNSDTMVYYVLLRAVDRFQSQMNRFPGLYDEQVELDIPAVKVIYMISNVISEYWQQDLQTSSK